jgi:small-conductance mechanosensitive channel
MQSSLEWIRAQGGAWGTWLASGFAIAVAVGAALLAHRFIIGVLRRATAHRDQAVLLEHAERPAKWILLVVAVGIAERAAPLSPWLLAIWRQALGLAMPALIGWLAFEMVRATEALIEARADILVQDNLAARRRRTRVGILSRVIGVLILFLTLCMMLLSIPGVRNVGVTLMASAGLAGLAVGAAAQPALKNLIAGIQMAFTEPIRIDDVVIIAGEWGRIEDIRLTYVVVKVWDERRLVVPISKFLEEPFQNWTRNSSQLLGSVQLHLDPTADVGRLRKQLEQIVKAQPLWDGRFFNLQVTELRPEAMEVRALMTAGDASKTFDLRCAVREAMMEFIARKMPEALPKYRLLGDPALSGGSGSAMSRATPQGFTSRP